MVDERKLVDIQAFAYEEGGKSLISSLVRMCWDRYLFASSLLQAENKTTRLLKELRSFDHRVLHDIYWTIAEKFRIENVEKEPTLPFECDEVDTLRLHEAWIRYWSSETNQLAQNADFVRDVCFATAYSNTDKGYQSEERLLQLVRSRY